MNLVDATEIEWKTDDLEDVKKEVAALKLSAPTKKEEVVTSDHSLFGKLKSVVRKAVDCCIE